ncbi:hypothetical protein EKG38_15610 [Shewanella canadensis]|uniref:Uncharacterized protein n=1 Tax=Shewanella canadensis TaxID=271096 RepID=A0A3S0KZQ0_9GAMM|nr:hypothetical protein [Shewanella canadensis]RTR37990.1 hypothetical protein EKG38_15610 [Shewanella canadensis]
MRHFLRAVKWILMALLAIPISLYFIVLLINMQDEAPSEQSKRNFAQIADNERTLAQNLDNNAYILALGFNVPKDAAPMAEGVKRLHLLQSLGIWDTVNAKQTARFELPNLPLEYCLGQDDFLLACKFNIEQKNNLEQEKNLKILLAENRWIIERYQQMLDMGNWQESTHYNVFIPGLSWQHLFSAQKLYLLDVYEKAGTKAPNLISLAIDQDMLFWQRISADTHLLISKMVSKGAMEINMKLGELIITQLPQQQQLAAIPQSWKNPMPPQVLSLNNAKLGEWHYFTKIAHATQVVDDTTDMATQVAKFLLLPLMQQQDTANRYADILVGTADMKECPNDLTVDTISQYIYNPMGKFILCSGIPSFQTYQEGLNELEYKRVSLVRDLNNKPRTKQALHNNR